MHRNKRNKLPLFHPVNIALEALVREKKVRKKEMKDIPSEK